MGDIPRMNNNELVLVFLEHVLLSKTFEIIFLNRCFKHKIEMLYKLVDGEIFDVHEIGAGIILDRVFCDTKYSLAYIGVLIKQIKSKNTDLQQRGHTKVEKILNLLQKVNINELIH
jgi:hypothetical protein